MTALWTAPDLITATAGHSPRQDWQVTGLSIDSRSLTPGDLFVALKGDNNNAHDYVAAVLAAGAGGVVVSETRPDWPADAPILHVADTMAALEAIGRAGRDRSTARIAAVTGSVGKTGSKETLAFLLGQQGIAAASQGNLNNQFGVPLSLGRLPRQVDYAVFELGMNHAGEIAPLARQVRPQVALITTIAPAHLEFFPDVAAIAREKASIAAGLQAGGTLVLPADSDYLADMRAVAGDVAIVTFGRSSGADVALLDSQSDGEGSDVTIRHRGRILRYRVGVPGAHWVANSLGVLATLAALGANLERAAQDYANIQAPKGRGARHTVPWADGRTISVIDESYNASPLALNAAIQVLAGITPAAHGRRVMVLGDMLELGPDAPSLHAGLAEPILVAGLDRVYTAGPLMRHLADRLPSTILAGHADRSADLIPTLLADLRSGDVVTVKGSLGSRMGPVVQALLAGGQG